MAETRDRSRPLQGRLKTTFWLDVALVVSVCALQNVPFTGLILHEWLGLAMVAMIFAHLRKIFSRVLENALLNWRAFSRLSLLSLAAAAFVALRGIYGASLRRNLPFPR